MNYKRKFSKRLDLGILSFLPPENMIFVSITALSVVYAVLLLKPINSCIVMNSYLSNVLVTAIALKERYNTNT